METLVRIHDRQCLRDPDADRRSEVPAAPCVEVCLQLEAQQLSSAPLDFPLQRRQCDVLGERRRQPPFQIPESLPPQNGSRNLT